ncbi:MAG: glycosyltransferase family 2 protein [Parcubacteria group bacterium]|nr:glycosyltransferase family 2 protein [Parcubacteria group bacterium]
MRVDHSLSIIIPAYNEEPTLEKVVRDVVSITAGFFRGYEIIIFNDASTDRTAEIADRLAAENPHIRVIHNQTNMNLGYNFQKGVELASMDYICMIPADDDIVYDALTNILQSAGKADVVLAYHGNYEARHPLRQIVSKFFILLLNTLFGMHLRYFNGPAVFEASALRGVKMTTFSFAYMAEIVITLLKRGHSYIEVPMILKPERKGANLRVFRWKNVANVVKTITSLFWRIQVMRRY